MRRLDLLIVALTFCAFFIAWRVYADEWQNRMRAVAASHTERTYIEVDFLDRPLVTEIRRPKSADTRPRLERSWTLIDDNGLSRWLYQARGNAIAVKITRGPLASTDVPALTDALLASRIFAHDTRPERQSDVHRKAQHYYRLRVTIGRPGHAQSRTVTFTDDDVRSVHRREYRITLTASTSAATAARSVLALQAVPNQSAPQAEALRLVENFGDREFLATQRQVDMRAGRL